jgi:hypothetical protein
VTVGAGWERYANPRFAVGFSYPSPTPQGHEVERQEQHVRDHRGDMERVHLSSPTSGELYFELACFRGIAPEDEYANHRPYLEKRFGEDGVSELTETTLLDRPAWAYSIRWDAGERAVLLLPLAGDTYRIIRDPRSELNDDVLATLTVSE